MPFHLDQPETHWLLIRFLHVLFGVLWIGLLYFFNLVNVPFMKEIDAPTKGKVVPTMVNRALWYFRWAALLTWLTGFIYYMKFAASGITEASVPPAAIAWPVWIVIWLVLAGVFYTGIYWLILMSPLSKDGRLLAVAVAVLALVFAIVVAAINNMMLHSDVHVVWIGVSGAFGTWMFLNVWGIIWRNNKKIIAWTKESAEKGTAMPPEAAALARQAFLASRTNAWLSLPLLFLMTYAGHGTWVP